MSSTIVILLYGVDGFSVLSDYRRGRRENLVVHEQLFDVGQPRRDGRHRRGRLLLREQRQLVDRRWFHAVRHDRRDRWRGHLFLRVRRLRQHRHFGGGSQRSRVLHTGGHDCCDERRVYRFVDRVAQISVIPTSRARTASSVHVIVQ